MQPYIFPYLGYFQLVNSVDKFIFYDDVNFIKKGWINRNKILINGKESIITFPLIKASQNKLINEIDLFLNNKDKKKIIAKLEMAYKKAPYFDSTIDLVKEIINADLSNIAKYSANSITKISDFLEIDVSFDFSSTQSPESKGMDKADRLIHICKKNNSNQYINSIGGQTLYSKEYFNANGINLSFIENYIEPYIQFEEEFVPNLSIIDIIMFNDTKTIRKMLNKYKLI